jgi:hypothetical protein
MVHPPMPNENDKRESVIRPQVRKCGIDDADTDYAEKRTVRESSNLNREG